MSNSKLLIGCDPEWFLQNYDGVPVSAINKFSGTKEEPVQLDWGVTVQVDNCAVEYGITPATCYNEWMDRNQSAKEQIGQIASSMGLRLHIVPSVLFPEEELDDERAWIFGCEPDFNAWVLDWNPSPKLPRPELRSAGGHIHVGYQMKPEDAPQYAKALDMFVALPGLLVDHDDRRRMLYGKAGAMRFKPYGFEWRTASNFWTATTSRIAWVYTAVQRAVEAVGKGIIVPAEVREIIDTANRDGAQSFCTAHGLEVPE